MAEWNRMDICEAFAVLECDYNRDGWLPERPSNRRRMESIGTQLNRINFRPASGLCFELLTDNGQQIYLERALAWGLPIDREHLQRLGELAGV
jgi:hypothetical protein